MPVPLGRRAPGLRRSLASGAFAAACVVVGLPASLSAQSAGSASGAAGGPDPRTIIERARKAYDRLKSLKADFQQVIEMPLLDRRRSGSGVWYQKGSGRFKMDFQDPPDDVIVADGQYVWLYYPSTNPGQVVRSSVDARRTDAGYADLQGRILSEAERDWGAEVVGGPELDGHPTWEVSLKPAGRSPYKEVRIWADRSSYLIRKFQITEENESVRTVTLTHLVPDAAIPDSVFHFTPPPGTDVFQG